MPIARFAVNRRVTVAMIACAIIVLGIFAFPRLPVDLLPSFSPPGRTRILPGRCIRRCCRSMHR